MYKKQKIIVFSALHVSINIAGWQKLKKDGLKAYFELETLLNSFNLDECKIRK